jgi:hypothetical protein
MIGLVLLYFIGNAFYKLAEQYNKKKWVFAILGIVTYYGGTFLAVFIYGVLSELEFFDITSIPEYALALLGAPFGLLTCWGLYVVLKRQWVNATKISNDEALDSDLIK